MEARLNEQASGSRLLMEVTSRPDLRLCNQRVERLYARLQERMTRKQRRWGLGLTVLDDPGVARRAHVLRRAMAFEKTLREMPIAIEDDDLIVGNTLEEDAIVRTQLPKYATEEERAQAREEVANVESGLAHKTPYYPDVLSRGISGILAELESKIAEIWSRPASEQRGETLELFQAMRIECKAIIAMANRYADLAEKLAVKEEKTARREELLRIARICRRVPEFPASSFHEAVQSIWFIHYGLFSTRTDLSCGRLDQYLYPYFRKDYEGRATTLEEAQELIDCLWIRFNDRAQICRENFAEEAIEAGKTMVWEAGHRKRPYLAVDNADAINHFGQNILISGITPDGRDGTNELTYLCLNALEKFALTQPVTTLRLHHGSPRELITRSAEVLKKGGGMPFINNDDALVQAYVDLGVRVEDARDYVNSNCWETMIQGKSDQELIRGVNFLLYLELALNRGVTRVSRERLGIDTGDPCGFKTFRDLMNAWKAQTDTQLKKSIDYIGEGYEKHGTVEHSGHGKYCYNPLLSALTLDCIEREKDVTKGGARYIIWHVMGEAVANTIDAMAAIKKAVYEDETLSMDELLAALESDWEDRENLRQRLVARIPKFANDDDYADSIGIELMDYFVDRTRYHAARHPSVIYPGSVGTFSWYMMIGREVGATPDGRHYGEPVAANMCPVPGEDVSGPTSAIRSYVKMRVRDLAAGAPIDLRFSGSSLKDEAGTQRLAGFIKSFIDMGGNILTLTVTDIEELRRAMKEPEKHRHLRVRMGGWSAYFVMLSEEQQRLHIQRVEHGLA